MSNIYDDIRELIKASELQLAKFEEYKTGEAEIDNNHEILVKAFKNWLEIIQNDLVNGELDTFETPEENVVERLKSVIKSINLVISKVESNKLNEMKFIKLLQELVSEAKAKKPSAGLSKKKKSAVVKKAKAGEDIGKKGKNFEKVEKKAEKEYGSKEAGKKVAAAAMWKNIKKK